MKGFSPGLSDSIASVIADPAQCPHCDSFSHIGGGLCVGCLLQAGLNPDDECAPEMLVSALAEITLPDKNWRLGNYEILEEIGRGGMGVIYRARQRHSRRIVAVKRVLGYHADSRETLARFRREAQAAASLDHPNILPIYEVSESEDGLPFFSMKFAPGGSLQEVRPALRNEPRQCVALVAKIARAVQYAHGKGILHRDLKPGNILLDCRGEPFVSDFGLAKWLDATSDLTRTLTIFGTPGYIAPEQASGPAAQLKPTADVYSLGAILFDLLAGRPPFLGSHALSVIRQAAENPAPKLRSLSKVADRDLETICARCLEREPSSRYRSAHDLAEDLERSLEGRPIIARPVLPPVRIWRWSKRNPLLASSIAACLALSSAIAAWQFQSQTARWRHVTAMHSVAVDSPLDLDAAQPDQKFGNALANALQRELSKHSLTQVRPTVGQAISIATSDRAANATPTTLNGPRTVLQGTKRVQQGKLRLSLRLLDSASGKIIYRRIVTGDAEETLPGVAAYATATDIYRLLDMPDFSLVKTAEEDPGWGNKHTRELLIAGRAVQERRTIVDLDRAIECFKKAVTAEPTSALAHSYLAEAQAGRVGLIREQTYLIDGENSAKTALRLNPNISEPHSAISMVRYFQGRFRESLSELLTAYELADGDGRLPLRAADILKILGQPGDAAAWYRLVLGKDSRPGWNEFSFGDCLSDLTSDEGAAAAYRHASEFFPELPEGWMGLCRLALLQGDFAKARNISSENWPRYRDHPYAEAMAAQVEFFSRNFPQAETLYAELAEHDKDGGGSFYGAVSYQSALGRARLNKNGVDILKTTLASELRALDATPDHPEVLYRIAAIESSLQLTDASVTHLRAAVKAGWIDYRSLVLDPRFDAIRQTKIYREIVTEIKHKVNLMRIAAEGQQRSAPP
jgi:serine/threonine protein kinase/tetratricopeptide (TPR) repeat protein